MSMIISLSGGTGSFASACIAHESGEPFRMVFADTLIEDEDCYRVLDEIEAKLGPVVRLVDGRTPWQVFADVGFIGNARTAHCSDILKRKQIRAWMDANTDPTDAMVIGMGLDEPERLKRAQVAWAPRPVRSLLAEHGWSHAQAVDCWRRYGIAPPRLYAMGFPHNNCGGFCVRAGHDAFGALLRHFPERYAAHEAQEAAALAAIKGGQPIMRDRTGGDTTGLTMAAFRERKDRQPEMFDWGGCGCFTEDAA
jgi:hypothetical protein